MSVGHVCIGTPPQRRFGGVLCSGYANGRNPHQRAIGLIAGRRRGTP
jgi:hypothetical protein